MDSTETAFGDGTFWTESNPGSDSSTGADVSPEQARGKTVDQRTDIWSFGVPDAEGERIP